MLCAHGPNEDDVPTGGGQCVLAGGEFRSVKQIAAGNGVPMRGQRHGGVQPWGETPVAFHTRRAFAGPKVV